MFTSGNAGRVAWVAFRHANALRLNCWVGSGTAWAMAGPRMSLALSMMLSRVSGRALTVGTTCWRLDFLTGTTDSIRVVVATGTESSGVSTFPASSFSIRILTVSLDKAFFRAHCSTCVRFCLADLLFVHRSPQPMHLDSWASWELGTRWSGCSLLTATDGRGRDWRGGLGGGGAREVMHANLESSSTSCNVGCELGDCYFELEANSPSMVPRDALFGVVCPSLMTFAL